ncbi:MAG TPA: hypothetical protein ENG62_00455, partial [Thermoplasmatales archaeon]|nr:hypothetical protein [Thermoplasmatales archaeon]
IASLIAAGGVSGVFIAITYDLSNSLTERSSRIQNQLDTEFTVINDNERIPTSGGRYLFYIKNIGEDTLVTTNQTFQILVDGNIVSSSKYYFSPEKISPGEVTTLYLSTTLSSGDHTIRVIGPQAVEDEFTFTI